MPDLQSSVMLELFKRVNKPQGLIESIEVNITPGRFKQYCCASLFEQISVNEHLLALSNTIDKFKLIMDPGGFGEEPKLKAISIGNSRSLLAHYGVEIISDNITRALDSLDSTNVCIPEWAQTKLDDIGQSWRKGKKPFGCGPEKYNNLVDAKRFIGACESGELGETDIRSASATLYRDSKRLEKIATLIATLYQDQIPSEIQETKDVLSYLGVHRYPPIFRSSGPLLISTKNGNVSAENSWPYLGVPPDGIIDLQLTKQPAYVLFIENQTTFDRYTREIHDGGLILYTNGFPSRQWQRLFKLASERVSRDIEFYHWGDVDIGGYRILCFMQKLINRHLTPHLMAPGDQHIREDADGVKKIPLDDLIAITENNQSSRIQDLYKELQNYKSVNDTLVWVEQEFLQIESPLMT